MNKHLTLLVFLMSSLALLSQSDCENAIELTTGDNTIESISGEITSELTCAPFNNGDAANWYTFTPDETGIYLITTSLNSNGGWDSRMQVLEGECGSLTCVGGDDDGGSGFTSELEINLEGATTYTIVLDNNWTSSGGTLYVGSPEDVEDYNDGTGGGGGGGEDPDLPETFITFNPTTMSNVSGGDCVVDMNGDFLDDIVSTSNSQITISYQQEDGSFIQETIPTPPAENSASWSITAGDLDNNGYNDLMYGGGSGVSIMMISDDGTAAEQWATDEYVFSQRGNMVDINMDGILDAFMCHDVAPNVYMISDGEGGFEYNQGGLGETENGGNYGSIWIDYNNDCLLDLFIAKCRGGNVPENINQMHRNNGDGTFTEVGEEIGLADNVQTWSSAWADFDNDGDMDVFVGASSTTNGSHKMMRNDDGVFVDITSETGIEDNFPTGIEHVAHDYNNDGYVDIDITGNTMLINNGDFTFTHSNSATNNGPVGDLNNDGYLDVVAFGGLINFNGETGNNWVKINTIGTASNKNGIGARVAITSNLGTQIRDVKAGDGFGNMSSITTHFGLGLDEEIENITIHWPSGQTTIVESPEINTTHNIVEIDGTIVNIEEILENDLAVYPNPAQDFISFESELNLNNVPLQIIDIQGKIVSEGLLKNGRFSVEALNPGSYIIQIEVNGNIGQRKFIKE